MSPLELMVMDPDEESVKTIDEFSRLTGDRVKLSSVDTKLLALCYQLHIKYSPDVSLRDKPLDQPNFSSTNSDLPPGFTLHCEDPNDGWLDEKSLMNGEDIQVALLTGDFAMQNVLLQMGLGLASVDGQRIRQLRRHIQRCRSCFATTPDMERQFCARCGNRSLHSCVVSIDAEGRQMLHVNAQRLQTHRGLKYSLPAPEGGKHARQPLLFEDQPVAQNRMARVRSRNGEVPFAVNDVTSRSAALGIRSFAHRPTQNPNAFAKGKKRGGKKR